MKKRRHPKEKGELMAGDPPHKTGQSWSRKYYTGLTDLEHQANDRWFKHALSLLTDDGILAVPNLVRAFNKQGEEVDVKRVLNR